jgi:cation diffusion facilitator family transporter
MESTQHASSAKAILYAFIANLGIALAKSWAAWFTSSGSMLAEAIHSYADCGNQLLLFVGLRQATRPADLEHPLGYGKVSYFWSFIVALLLFSMGGLFSIYEGWHKLGAPEPLNQAWVALLVIGVSIGLEIASLMGCLREIRAVRGTRSLKAWLKTTRNAELVVVLGEDVAALIGLSIAFCFIGLAAVTGNPAFDAIGSMCIGVILVVISLWMASRIKSLIVGRSAEPELRRLIDAYIEDHAAIDGVFNTITLQLGPKVMLAAKIKMQPDIALEAAVSAINDLEARIKVEFPEIAWCFIEPDVKD